MKTRYRSYSSTKYKLLLLCLGVLLSRQTGVNSEANEEKYIQGRGTKQISDINMLLPTSGCEDCRKVSYSISAINGCYQWEVSHPNLIEITPVQSTVQPECANIAQVKALSTKPTKSLVWISAKDQHSGYVLRCEVKLGRIQRLDIHTHLRQFYLNDYEELNIAAYDEEGNIFSGLDGFRFEWNIDAGNDNVKVVTHEEASLYSQKKEFAFSKLQSDNFYLKGVKQGVSRVSAKISEPTYEQVGQTQVTLTITEAFVVTPTSKVFIAPTTRYQFELAKVQRKMNDMHYLPVALPNRQYHWNVDNSSVGDIGEDGVFISKDKQGLANILVVDTSIANNTAESQIRVTLPHFLEVEIADVTQQINVDKTIVLKESRHSYQKQLNVASWENNWYLVKDHLYLLKVSIYDRDKNPIYISDNMVIQALIDKKYFDIILANTISSEVIVRAKTLTPQNQKIPISFALDAIRSQAGKLSYQVDKTRIRSDKEVAISEKIKISDPGNHNLILLPYIKSQDESRTGEIWHLSADGGSGVYHWSVDNAQVASISGAGLVKSNEVGHTVVTVRDVQNNKNFDTIQIEVTPIVSLSWLEDHIESRRQSDSVVLSLIAHDNDGRKFTNCTAIDAAFDLKGAGILTPLVTPKDYSDIKTYVIRNRELMDLKQRFEMHPSATFLSELKNASIITEQNQQFFTHNNFGICQQQRYFASSEGLARVKAQVLASGQVLETKYAEVAVFDQLATRSPHYSDIFDSLYSKHNLLSEELNYAKYAVPNTFILSFGSSIFWQISGGTNFWKDIPEKYQSTTSHQLLSQQGDQAVLKTDKVSEQTAQFIFQVLCQKPSTKPQMVKPHNFRVTVNQQNMVSRSLLRPAQHQLSIEVKCEPPQSVQLLWSQANNSLSSYEYQQLPLSRVVNQERVHYVLANSQHHVRYLMLDENTHAFFNHSSIATDVKSSDEKMVKVALTNSSIEEAVRNNDYDFRKITVLNQTGTVYLHSEAKGYYSRFFRESASASEVEPLQLPYDVKDRMRLEVVYNVDVQPKYKSIYMHPENQFKFTITHGSGHFIVTINNTAIADKVYIDGQRTITIVPKKEGPLEIRVEDVELPGSIVSVSELLISDIKSLELEALGTLIEQGSSMPLNVTAYDTYGIPFDADQYAHMTFHIEIEATQQRDRGLQTEVDPKDRRSFIARGYEPGNYQTTAFTFKYNPKAGSDVVRVSSEVLKVEVFPLLQIHPGSLLLTPYMKYTLQILGGPSRTVYTQSYHGGAVEINFKVQSEKIATVDKFREVTAHQVGDTNLYYEIVQIKQSKNDVQRRTIVSSETIPIRVRLATSVDIPFSNERTVYANSMIKLVAILKFHEETFTHGIAPISYSWNASSPSTLQLNLPTAGKAPESTALVLANKKIRDNEQNNNNAVFSSHFNSSTVYSTGLRQGEAQVSVQVALEYPDLYRGERNWFSKTVTLRVRDKLKVDIQESLNDEEKQTHLYLMPPNSYSKIETNRKTRLRLSYSQQSVYDYSTNSYHYKESQAPIIQLVNEEAIRTLDKYGKVTVIIEEKEAFNDQVVMLNVLITDIFSIATKDVYQALSFPLGSSMQIPIKFLNERGHQFASNIEGIEVALELSHPRVLSAALDGFNASIALKAEGSGQCNVLVYLVKAPHIFDLFKVRVSSVVKPYSPVQLHLGGTVQFKVMDAIAHETSWASAAPQILEVNSRTGLARGLQEGKTEVLLSNIMASIVQVSKVKYAEVDTLSRPHLVINADEPPAEVRIRLKLYLQDQQEELTPTVQFDGVTLIRQNLQLQCESDSPNVLSARGLVDEVEGFFCVLAYRPQRAVPKSAQVAVWVSGDLYREKLVTLDVSFLSKIKVETFYRNGVKLFSDDRTASVQVFSNTPFSVQVENLSQDDRGYELVKHRLNKTQEDGTEYIITVAVPKEITHNFDSRLLLTQPATGAQTVIPISFETRAGRNILSKPTQAITRQYDDYVEQPQRTLPSAASETTLSGRLFQLLLFGVFGLALTSFILANFFKIDPVDFFGDLLNLRNPFRAAPAPQVRRNPPGSLVRAPTYHQQFPMASNSFGLDTSQAGAARQAQPLNLSRVDASVDSTKKYKNTMYSHYGNRS